MCIGPYVRPRSAPRRPVGRGRDRQPLRHVQQQGRGGGQGGLLLLLLPQAAEAEGVPEGRVRPHGGVLEEGRGREVVLFLKNAFPQQGSE